MWQTPPIWRRSKWRFVSWILEIILIAGFIFPVSFAIFGGGWVMWGVSFLLYWAHGLVSGMVAVARCERDKSRYELYFPEGE